MLDGSLSARLSLELPTLRGSGYLGKGWKARGFLKKMQYDEKLLKNIAETGVISLPQMKLVWEVLQEKMLDRLVVEQKGVNFGVFEVIPVPYRSNWKNALHDEFKGIGADFKGRGLEGCVDIAKDRGMWAEMSNTRLLAFKNDHIYWTLEVIPRKAWWENVVRAERERRSRLSAADYCRYVAKVVYKLKEKLLDVYRSFISQAGFPCGGIRNSRTAGGHFLVPFIRSRQVSAKHPDQRGPVGVVVNLRDALHANGGLDHTAGEVPRVLAVSDIRETEKDVR